MTIRALKLITYFSVFICSQSLANYTIFEDKTDKADLYGFLSMNYYDNETRDSAELIDGWSRIGLDFTHQLPDDWQANARVEWGVSIVDRTTSLEVQAGNGLRPQNTGDDIFWNRIGYIGFSHEKWGTIQFGKQWSVYFDITGITDYYAHLSAYSGGSYNFSDGGISGVGRVDSAITYRNSWNNLSFGIQYQSQDETIEAVINNGNNTASTPVAKVGDTFAMSANYKVDKVALGLAYNQMEIEELISGIKIDDSKIIAASLAYGKFAQSGFFGVVMATNSENHEADDEGNLFDGKSLEASASYRFDNEIAFYATYQQLNEDDSDYQGHYKLKEVLVGARYFWSPRVTLFIEGKQDDSTHANGNDSNNNIVLVGVQYTL